MRAFRCQSDILLCGRSRIASWRSSKPQGTFARRKTNTYAGPRFPKQIKAATKVNELAISTLLLFLNALMAR